MFEKLLASFGASAQGAAAQGPATAAVPATGTDTSAAAGVARRCSADRPPVTSAPAGAHWGLEYDGLDFFECLVVSPCYAPSH